MSFALLLLWKRTWACQPLLEVFPQTFSFFLSYFFRQFSFPRFPPLSGFLVSFFSPLSFLIRTEEEKNHLELQHTPERRHLHLAVLHNTEQCTRGLFITSSPGLLLPSRVEDVDISITRTFLQQKRKWSRLQFREAAVCVASIDCNYSFQAAISDIAYFSLWDRVEAWEFHDALLPSPLMDKKNWLRLLLGQTDRLNPTGWLTKHTDWLYLDAMSVSQNLKTARPTPLTQNLFPFLLLAISHKFAVN